jgi:DNA replication protein DnaC
LGLWLLPLAKLLIIDELGYLPSRSAPRTSSSSSSPGVRAGQPADRDETGRHEWGVVFGDDLLAAATLDRLLRQSHTLMIQGESCR